MEALVFSKNRPMQLELLLHSHKRFWDEKITVLYRATEPEYQQGYDKLSVSYPQVLFIRENNFKQQVVDYVKRNKYSVFFCDDDVMIRPVKDFIQRLKDKKVLCISMRLDPKYDYHFEKEIIVAKPVMYDNKWVWQDSCEDWNFPMSVLGHVFRSKELLPLCETLIYNSPNQFESVLADNSLSNPFMVCFDEARTINIPANLVQNTYNNRAGKVSVKRLNNKFLEGYRIDLDDVIEKTKNARSCFMLVPFKFIKR